MRYKVIKRGKPGVPGGGDQKYYASPVYNGDTTIKELGRRLSAQSAITKADAIAVVTGLIDLIAEDLKDGKIVRLGDLGTFRISLSSNGEDSAEQVTSKSIKSSRVLFRPAADFQSSLIGLTFSKAKDISANPKEAANT